MTFQQVDPDDTYCYDCGLILWNGDSIITIDNFPSTGLKAFFHSKCWYEAEAKK